MLDVTLLIVITAAVAASAVDLVSGPLLLRSLLNRWIVLRWLLAGVRSWWTSTGFFAGIQSFTSPSTVVDSARDEFIAFTQLRLAEKYTQPHWTERDWTLEHHLVRLATGGKASALYRLEGDQLAAQINAAAEAVLDKPRLNAPLLVALAAITRPELKESAEAPSDRFDSIERLLTTESTITSETPKDTLAARHEVTLRTQRRLDDLQITTRGYQQIVHFALCVAAGIGAAFALRLALAVRVDLQVGLPPGEVQAVTTQQGWMVIGILGGSIAPLLNRMRRTPSA